MRIRNLALLAAGVFLISFTIGEFGNAFPLWMRVAAAATLVGLLAYFIVRLEVRHRISKS